VLIDCDSCAMRDIACSDCVVTMLLAQPRQSGESLDGYVDLDEAEQQAVDMLCAGGLVSPLRLVPLTTSDRLDASRRHIA
jgi:hypothetical protein